LKTGHRRNADRQQNGRKNAGERQTGSRMKYRPQIADRWAAYKQEDRGIQSDRLLTGRRKQTDRLSNRLQEHRQAAYWQTCCRRQTDRQWTSRQAARDRETSRRLADRLQETDRHAEDWYTGSGRLTGIFS
jgi:hypothetical protein